MSENLAAKTVDALIRNEQSQAVDALQELIHSRAQELVYDRFAGPDQDDLDEETLEEAPFVDKIKSALSGKRDVVDAGNGNVGVSQARLRSATLGDDKEDAREWLPDNRRADK